MWFFRFILNSIGVLIIIFGFGFILLTWFAQANPAHSLNQKLIMSLVGSIFIITPWYFMHRFRVRKISTKSLKESYKTINSINVDNLSDKEFNQIFSKKSKLVSQKVFLLPTSIKLETNISYDFQGKTGQWNKNKWQNIVRDYNSKSNDYLNIQSQNNQLKRDHVTAMQSYEVSKQLYNNAKMLRNQQIGNAKPGNKVLPYLLNPIGSPPKEPKLLLHKLPEIPKKH